MKRAFDIVASGGLLLLFSPLLLLCVALIRFSSPGPSIFMQWRCGRKERPFRLLKFRTMIVDAEQWLEANPDFRDKHRKNGFKLTRREDPRVIPIGHFLRFSHLDELPQLLNVFRGEMSLVGPRPVERGQYELWLSMNPEAEKILSVKPGIFGNWTAQGRNRGGDAERIRVELEYVRDWSLRGDLFLLFRHIPVLLRGQEEA